jgi:L-lysine 6-transaminase
MCAFDLPDKAMRNKFITEVMKQGVVMLGCGERTVRFRPPLTLTLAEAEEGMTLVRNAVKATL